jgi:hypothetical protein
MPVHCVIIDKRANKAAKDLWVDIQKEIGKAELCLFDVSGFRPNVILELGYALAIKNNDQILISFKQRKSHGQTPAWLLSDITHLQRHQYRNVSDLEKLLRKQLSHMTYMQDFVEFQKWCERETSAPLKYQENGLQILRAIRDQGEKTETQLQKLLQGSSCRIDKMRVGLRLHKLVARRQGPNGRHYIP